MINLKQALKERKLTVGSWIQTGSPVAAEILAATGYDWLAVDCEHSEIGLEMMASVFRAISAFDVAALVRVRENDTLAIRQALDMGANGVIVPLVNNAEQARKAVAAAKYPPEGVRGFGYCRMNEWGRRFDDYAANANQNIAVIVMIESKEAVDNIDEILSVPGVDGVFIGPYDMSSTYGLTGQTEHPVILEACRRVGEACAAHKVSAGWHIVLPTKEKYQTARNFGFTFLALGADIVFLRNGSDAAYQSLQTVFGK